MKRKPLAYTGLQQRPPSPTFILSHMVCVCVYLPASSLCLCVFVPALSCLRSCLKLSCLCDSPGLSPVWHPELEPLGSIGLLDHLVLLCQELLLQHGRLDPG